MNSEFLGDILECSVCLRSLDEQNKVLPCQHTFCKSCLDSIVKSQKELRCPECRILVHERVSDLPSNILLLRLLDGIRNQQNRILLASNHEARARRHSVEGVLSEPVPASGGAKDGGMDGISSRGCANQKPTSNRVELIKPSAKALYRYEPEQPSDLSFEKGDTIYLLEKLDSNWMRGECRGRTGVFPISYIKVVKPLPSKNPLCVALYDFQSNRDDPDRDCLHFVKNDIMSVIRRVDGNWAEGALDDKIGIFPLSFVKLNDEARKLIEDISSPAGVISGGRSQQRGSARSAFRRISSHQRGNESNKRHSLPDLSAGSDEDGFLLQSSNRSFVDLDSPASTSFNTRNSSGDVGRLSSKPSREHQDKEEIRNKKNDIRILSKPAGRARGGATTTGPSTSSPSTRAPSSQIFAVKSKDESFFSKHHNVKDMSLSARLLPAKKPTPNRTPPSGLKDLSPKSQRHPSPKKGHGAHGRSKSFECDSSNSLEIPLPSSSSRPSRSSNTKPSSSNTKRPSSSSTPFPNKPSDHNSVAAFNGIRTRVHLPPRYSNGNRNFAAVPGNIKSITPPSPTDSKVKFRLKPPSHGPHENEAASGDRSLDIPRKSQSAGDDSKKSSEKDKRRDRSSLFTKMITKTSAGRKLKTSLPFRSLSTPNSSFPDVVHSPFTSSSRDQDRSCMKSLSRDRYRVAMNYPAQTSEELELTEGDVVVVYQRNPDGWFQGTHQGNGKSGYFPSTFVDRIFH